MMVVTEVNNKPTVGGIMRPVNSGRLCEVFTGRFDKDGLSLQNFGTDAFEFAVLF